MNWRLVFYPICFLLGHVPSEIVKCECAEGACLESVCSRCGLPIYLECCSC